MSQLTALKPKLHKLEKKSQQGENGPLFEKHTFSEQKERGEDGVFHDVAEDDVRGETYSHVDLRVLQTEHHPAVHGLRAATEIGVLREGEECEDRKHDERGMVAEDVERGDLLVQRRHQG